MRRRAVADSRGDGIIEHLYFLQRFLRHPWQVASVVPSSRTLARVLVGKLDLNDDDLVIEYGPGTGVFTREIDRAISAGRQIRYLGIERDPSLCRYLSQRFTNLDFVCDDVLNIEAIHAERALGPARAIISSVPLIFMREPELRQVLTATRSCLKPNGVFRAISYVHSYPGRGARRLRAEMRASFPEFGIGRPVWRNLPPALVLSGGLQPDAAIASRGPATAPHSVTESSNLPGTI